MKKILIVSTALAAMSTAHAFNLDVKLNNDNIGTDVFLPMGSAAEVKFGAHYAKDVGNLFDAGFHVTHEEGVQDFAFGAKWVTMTNTRYDAQSVIAFGGRYRAFLNHKLAFAGDAYFAPNVTSFNEAEGYSQIDGRAEFHFMPNASLKVGYRHVSMHMSGNRQDIKFDNNVYLGASFLF